ncbi:DUF6221 family protein [Streptomyces anthocyanicus]|uniref:DUF6221 family protein n=1 Tax=Streptomyces anthocyanicus TaxID=68174 RepID=UPI0037F20AC2
MDDDPFSAVDRGVTVIKPDELAVMMEFLKARLREDETAADAVNASKNQDLARLKVRVLADVAAKRRLMCWVEKPRDKTAELTTDGTTWKDRAVNGALDMFTDLWVSRRDQVICELVAAYEGHPDFRSEWKPTEDEYEPADVEKRR